MTDEAVATSSVMSQTVPFHIMLCNAKGHPYYDVIMMSLTHSWSCFCCNVYICKNVATHAHEHIHSCQMNGHLVSTEVLPDVNECSGVVQYIGTHY